MRAWALAGVSGSSGLAATLPSATAWAIPRPVEGRFRASSSSSSSPISLQPTLDRQPTTGLTRHGELHNTCSCPPPQPATVLSQTRAAHPV
jgi:hypothetical protein